MASVKSFVSGIIETANRDLYTLYVHCTYRAANLFLSSFVFIEIGICIHYMYTVRIGPLISFYPHLSSLK